MKPLIQMTRTCSVCGRRMLIPIECLGQPIRCAHCGADNPQEIATKESVRKPSQPVASLLEMSCEDTVHAN